MFLKPTFVLITVLVIVTARVLTPEEFGDIMRANGVTEDIDIWTCIAEFESSFNTSAHNTASGDHGLFQINERWWCSPEGTECGMTCDSLRDEELTNDIECAMIVYNQTEKQSGNGFTAWHAYELHCV